MLNIQEQHLIVFNWCTLGGWKAVVYITKNTISYSEPNILFTSKIVQQTFKMFFAVFLGSNQTRGFSFRDPNSYRDEEH